MCTCVVKNMYIEERRRGESNYEGKYYHTAGLIFEMIFHSKEKSFVGPDV